LPNRILRLLPSLLPILLLSLLAACGGGSSDSANGTVKIRLTDAPAGENGIDNVWITVRGVMFHLVDAADPEDTGWIGRRFADNETVTVNLARLANGEMQTVFDNISLPPGRYRQILLFVEPTRAIDNVAASAGAAGLRYNNQVDTAAGAAPLRIPDALRGIRLAGTFDVVSGVKLDLAIDFDIGHDVVEISRGAVREYLLKPLLRYFDLGRAGAIVGRIDSAAALDNAAFFVFKAEQPNADNSYRVVRRFTTLADNTGRFVFYPLAPGRYDIVLRGRHRKTAIVRNVNVLAGGTPSVGFADLGTVTMDAGAEITVGASVSPSGSWIDFYQTLPGDSVPYEIRFRHVNPFTGSFEGNIALSAEGIKVGTWNGGNPVAFTTVLPMDNTFSPAAGAFSAVADALLYDRSAPLPVNLVDNNSTLAFPALVPSAPANPAGNTASGHIRMSAAGMGLTSGLMLAVRDGLVIDRLDVTAMMGNNGGNYAFANLPGGTTLAPFARGVYGLETIGWSSSSVAVGFRDLTFLPAIADLRFGNRSTINLWMWPLR
jgi:hypothetical protein